MNIKENYKREMDNIRHRKSTDVKITPLKHFYPLYLSYQSH